MLLNNLRRFSIAASMLIVCGWSSPALQGQETEAASTATTETEGTTNAEADPVYHNERVRGRVVWMADALKDEFGISTVPESQDRVLAIKTEDGKLLPLVENLRGRAFRKDERLRDRPMEIWVRRYQDQPLVQVLRIFELTDDEMMEVDYWCDVCAIVMFETGPCSCCQDHNRLRKREVDPDELEFTR